MKKTFLRICLFMITALVIGLSLGSAKSDGQGSESLVSVLASAQPTQSPLAEEVSAVSAVVIDADSGLVLWEKNCKRKMPMASTTKIMTAWLALQREDLDDRFTVNSRAIAVEGSSMGLCEGDEVSLRDLAVGMLTVSGNDAANAAAVRISGSVSAFVKQMNLTAASLGLNDTSFVTPSGLDAAGHYSTAYDMAVLASCALENEAFAQICSATSSFATYGNPPYLRSLMNGTRLLRSYEGAVGVKTGYTTKAGRCLVSAARRNGIGLICVTLNAPDDWNDHTKLLDYGFSVMQRVELTPERVSYELPVAGTSKTVTALAAGRAQVSCFYGQEDKIECVVNLPEFVFAPLRAGTEIGYIEYFYNGKSVARISLVAAADVEQPTENYGFIRRIRDFFTKGN